MTLHDIGVCGVLLSLLWLTQEEAAKPVVDKSVRTCFVVKPGGELEKVLEPRVALNYGRFLLLIRFDELRSELSAPELKISQWEDDFTKIDTSWRTLTQIEFHKKVSELERDVRDTLTDSDNKLCENLLLLDDFYRMGPRAFAKKFGASPTEKLRIRKQVRDFAKILRDKLTKLESDWYKELYALLPEETGNELTLISDTTQLERLPVVSTIWLSLRQLEDGSWEEISTDSFNANPKLTFTFGGCLSQKSVVSINQFSELQVLISQQDWSLKNVETKTGTGPVIDKLGRFGNLM